MGTGRRAGLVRIHEAAQAAGARIATVAKALNGAGRGAEATRLRLRQAVADLGVRPDAVARALFRRHRLSVGLPTTDACGRLTAQVMSGVPEATVDEGVSVLLRTVGDGPERARTLDPDDAQGSRGATRRLAGLGRRRLAHVTAPGSSAPVRGSAAAVREVAGDGAPVLLGAWSEARGHAAVARLRAEGAEGAEGADGGVCGTDQIARGVADALRETGVAVPSEGSVVGSDDREIVAAATPPPLTTVDMKLGAPGREAGRPMPALAAGEAVGPGVRRRPSRLVVRASCGAAARP